MYERMAALELDIIIKGGNQKQIYIGFCLTLGTIKNDEKKSNNLLGTYLGLAQLVVRLGYFSLHSIALLTNSRQL